jgi:hypothetical protein
MVRAFLASVALLVCGGVAHATTPNDSQVGWNTAMCSDNVSATFSGYCMGPASRLDITIHAFQLRRLSDQVMVTVASGSQTFDFASVSANTDIGAYASSLQVPYGTYDALGFHIGINTTFAGQTNGGAAGDCAITASGFSTSLGSAAPRTIDMRDLGLEHDNDAVVIAPGDRLQGIDDEATGLPFTVAPGDSVDFAMSVSAGRGIWYQYTNGVCVDAGPYGPRVRTGFTVN